MVPVCTDTPPTRRPFSITSTRLPSLAPWIAARRPDGPLPMTMKSNAATAAPLGTDDAGAADARSAAMSDRRTPSAIAWSLQQFAS